MPSRTSNLDPAFDRAIREVLFDHPLPCPHCRYDLCGITGGICPECGNEVESYLRVADLSPHRFRRQQWDRAKRVAVTVVRTLVMVVAFLAIAAFLVWV